MRYWPGCRYPASGRWCRNDASCVLLIDDGANQVILTGDIEKMAEKKLLEKPEKLSADIITASRHGSNTSSTRAFVDAVIPQIVVVPAGYRNRYQFPTSAVVERYQAVGSDIMITGTSGAVLFRPDSQGQFQPQRLRLQQRYPWRADATE